MLNARLHNRFHAAHSVPLTSTVFHVSTKSDQSAFGHVSLSAGKLPTAIMAKASNAVVVASASGAATIIQDDLQNTYQRLLGP
jgi:hypothetical protein